VGQKMGFLLRKNESNCISEGEPFLRQLLQLQLFEDNECHGIIFSLPDVFLDTLSFCYSNWAKSYVFDN